MKKTIISAFVMIILSGFKNINMDQPSFSLYDTKWYLTSLHTGSDQKDITLKKAFIKFNEEKGTAGGNGSCNSFGGSLTVNKDSLQIKNIFSTKMYCEQVQQTENSLFSLLAKVNRFEIKQQQLFLYSGKELLLEFTGDEVF